MTEPTKIIVQRDRDEVSNQHNLAAIEETLASHTQPLTWPLLRSDAHPIGAGDNFNFLFACDQPINSVLLLSLE